MGSSGHGYTGPGLIVSHTGGAASFPQFDLGFARSSTVVPPKLAVLIGYAMPSFPAATQTPIENMQAGPAEPQSSSDQLPSAILGKTRTTALLFSSALIFAVASLRAPPFIPLFTGLRASLGALSPASLFACNFCCPDRTKSIHGVQ